MLCCKKISGMDSGMPSSMKYEPISESIRAKKDAISDTLRVFSPNILEVKTVHWPALPLNPFDMHFFEKPAYLLHCSRPIGLNEFHELKTYFRENLKNTAAVLIQEHPGIWSSIDSDLVDHWGSFPGSSDMLSTLLADRPHSLTIAEKERFETRTRSFQMQLADTLGHPEFGRLSLSVLALFLFNALRVLIFSHELHWGKWRWLVTADEIAGYLSTHTPLEPSFLKLLKAQFEQARLNGHPFDELLLPKARALLGKMLDIAQNGDSWESLETINDLEDEKRLRISLTIITANRPRQLERCIQSIGRLGRLPEEMIIVDGGTESMDLLAPVISDFPFPVHHLRTEPAGVANARNVAVDAAKGDIIAFVDDDICVESDWLERLERVFLRDPQVGIASGSILNLKCGRSDMISKYMDIVEKI
jgi:hypothetical protein